jgi:hypothetical protein
MLEFNTIFTNYHTYSISKDNKKTHGILMNTNVSYSIKINLQQNIIFHIINRYGWQTLSSSPLIPIHFYTIPS